MSLRSQRGFTLLEVMIAMAIMVVAFASILMVQSSSINASLRARQMNVVSMLAKGLMVETELLYEGKPFNEVKKEDAGQFKDPYQDYRWTRVIKEIEFPNLSMGGGEGGKGGGDEGQSSGVETLTKLLTTFISKAAREVTVTVFWKSGGGERSFSVTTYWVDLNHEFTLSQ